MSSVVVILLTVITSVNSIVSKKNLVIYDKVGKKSIYDSLNVRYVGGWPFGPSWTVAVDSVRDYVFLGSGGGVYILDVSDPHWPVKVSERIHTRGSVNDLYYDVTRQFLYVADGPGGLEVLALLIFLN